MAFYWNASGLYSAIAVIAGAFEGDDVVVELQQLRVGREQGTPGFELRGVVSLARLLGEQGRREADARPTRAGLRLFTSTPRPHRGEDAALAA